MHNTNSLLLVLTIFLHFSKIQSEYTFTQPKSQLIFVPLKGKNAPLELTDENFTFVKTLESPQQNDRVYKKYSIMFKPRSPGWIIKKALGKKKSKFEQGDSLFFFPNTMSRLNVGSLSFEAPKSDKKDLASIGYLSLLNAPLDGVDDYLVTRNPVMFLVPFDLEESPDKFAASFFSHEKVFKKASKQAKQFLKYVSDKPSYEDLLNSDESVKTAFLKHLFEEMAEGSFGAVTWSRLGSKQKQDKIKYFIKSSAVKLADLNLSIFRNKRAEFDQEKFNQLFSLFLRDNATNLLLFLVKTTEPALGSVSVSILDPESQQPSASFIKHTKQRLVGAFLSQLKGLNLSTTSNQINYGAFEETLYQFKTNKQEIAEYLEEVVQWLKLKMHFYLNDHWLEAYYWVSQIEGVDEFLCSYVTQTLGNSTFKKLYMNGDSLGLDRIERARVYVNASNARSSRLRERVFLVDKTRLVLV